jgi:hypothetical protein
MGDLIPSRRLIDKQVERDEIKYMKELCRRTANWADPEPPTPEQRQMQEEGAMEL